MRHVELEMTPGLKRIKEILGCKWSIPILLTIQSGVRRPGCIVKENEGLADRVLHRCLKKMLEDKLISRRILSEIPSHTEYRLTARGQSFMKLLGALQKFSADWKVGESE